ncbi:MAG TPA: DeoR/GlpR transcriptional regulator [Anaerolineae bacterium]|nr:DeoR/GlpR transcriptional regulator [Anaerolineae bacterium]
MPINKRLKNILEILENEEGSRVADLSRQLNVSEATIRRDLHALEVENKIKRVHGGAILTERSPFEPPIHKRIRQYEREKQAIGRETATLIANGETVFLGSGTTTLEVAKHLNNRENLSLITNSLLVAQLLATSGFINLIFLGGFLRSSELSFIGHITEQAISEVRVDKIVIGIPAIDVKVGLTNDYLPEVRTDRAILSMSDKLIVVADHTKFGKIASAYLAPITRITTLVTDKQTDSDTLDRIRAEGIEVIIAT